MNEKLKKGNWPLLVTSSGGMIHITNYNFVGGGTSCMVRTECGRTIQHCGSLSSTPEEILASDGKTIILHKMWGYKFCPKCGSKEQFADAKRRYDEATADISRKLDAEREAKRKAVANMQATARAFVYSILPEGSTDVEEDGWGLKFVHGGVPYRMAPTDEECRRLHAAAEEASCPSE